MKKILSFFAIAAAVCGFSSCATEQEDVFDKSAAERMDQALTDYTARLKDSKGGWIMEYYTLPEDRSHLIAVRFNEDESCTMATIDDFFGNDYVEEKSIWQMIADNGPVLSFNTYNKCLHTFASPDPNYNEATGVYDGDGYGMEGDYEFMVINAEAKADTIMLKGKKRATYNRMTRIPEGVDFKTYLTDLSSFDDNHFAYSNCAVLHFGDVAYRMNKQLARCSVIYPYDGLEMADGKTYFYSTIKEMDGKYRLRFSEPVVGPEDKAVARNFTFDEAKQAFVCQEDETITITGPDIIEVFKDNAFNTLAFNIGGNANWSDDFVAANEKMRSDFTAKGNMAPTVKLSSDEENVIVKFSYRDSKRKSQSATFALAKSLENGVYKLAAPKAQDAVGEQLLADIPAVAAFLNLLADSYTVGTATGTSFVIPDFKLVSVSNPNKYIIIENS